MAQAKKKITSSKARTQKKGVKREPWEEQSDLMESIFNAITDGITVIDQNYNITHINRSLVHFYGYDNPEEVIGKKCHVIYRGNDKRCRDCYSKEVFETGKPTHQFIERKDRHGKPLFWEINIFPILDEKGRTQKVVYYSRNITKEKMLEEEIKESEKKLSDILSVSRDVVTEVDTDMKVSFVTPNVSDFLGFTAEEILEKKNFLDLMTPKTRKIAVKNFKARIGGKKIPPLYEMEFLHKDGTVIPVEVNISLRKKDGRVLGIVATARDITERKAAQEALIESEKRYRTLFEKSPDSITLLDVKGDIIDCNKATEKLIGFKKKEILGKHFDNLLTLDKKDMPRILENFKKLAKGLSIKPYELEITQKKGAKRWINVTSTSFEREGEIMGFQVISRDITEHKKAEEKLKESESLYRTLVETSPDGITLVDMDTNIVMTNAQGARNLGYTLEEVKGMSAFDLMAPEDQPRIMETVSDLVEKGRIQNVEFTFMHKDGFRVPIEYNASLVLDEKGEPIYLLGVSRDISERKKAREQVLMANERLQYLLSSTSAVIYSSEATGDYGATFVSDNIEELVGYKPSSFTNKNGFWYNLVHPDDRNQIAEEISKLNELGHHTYEYRFKRKDGKYIWVRDEMRMVRDEEGNPLEIVGFWMDITDTRDAEERIRESENRYSNLFQKSNDAIFLHDMEGNIIDVNQKALDLLGYSKREIKKLNISKLHPKAALKTSRLAFKTISEDGHVEFEVYFKKNNGDVFLAEVSSSLFEIGGKKVIQGIVRDITERKKAEIALKESEELYRALVNASPDAITVTDLEGNITHVSEQTLKVHGARSEKDLIGKNALELIAPEDHERATANLEKTLNDGLVRNLEYILLKKDGIRFTGELSASLIRDAGGNPKAFIATTRDITERKIAEEKIKELAKFNRDIVQSMKGGITILDLEGLITFINPEVEKKLGYKRKELLGESWEKILAEDYFRRMRDCLADSMDGKDARFEGVLVGKDKSELPVLISASPQYEDEILTSILVEITDISERRKERIAREELMKFKVKRGNTYLIKEKEFDLARDVSLELYKNRFKGIVISREHPEKIKGKIDVDMSVFWLTKDPKDKTSVKPDFTLLEKIIDDEIDRDTFVLLNRFDYLVTQNGFMETLNFIQHLNEMFYARKSILILSFDPNTLNSQELSLLEKETTVIERRREERLSADLLDLLEFINNRNRAGEKPSYKDIGNKFRVSRTTARKRINELADKGLIAEEKHGRFKYLAITEKGKASV